MGNIMFGLVLIYLFVGGLGTALIAGLYSDFRSKIIPFVGVPVVIFLLIMATYLVPNITYNSARAKFVHNNMLVEMYEEELGKLDGGINEVQKLNPDAMLLMNEDTPIATTMKLRAEMIRSLTLAKKKAYDARVAMSEIENSIFSFAANPLKEEMK